MQNLFARGAPWETPWLERVLPQIREIASCHPQHTVFTRFIPPQRPEHARGTWRRYYERWQALTRDHIDPALLELLPPLAALVPPATVIDKPCYSPFLHSGLPGLLREWRTEALVVSGAETDVCVLSAVLDAVDLGYRVVVVEDAVCSSSDVTHDALMTLYRQRLSLQIELADTETVLRQWPR
jgi:nicotinamidase-related amidase